MLLGHLNIFFPDCLLSPLSIFELVCLFIVEFEEFSIYSQYKSFIRYVTCKYFLSICDLPFYSVGSVFWCTTFFQFDKVKFICFFPFVAVLWGHISEKPLLISKSWRFNLYKLQCSHLALWPILSWFLYTMWGRGPISFFCIWVANYPITTCWRD